MIYPCLSICILCRICLNNLLYLLSASDSFLCFLGKEGFLHYHKLYPGLGVGKTICFIWAVFHKMIEVFGLVPLFPSPHSRVITVLKLYFHIPLVRDSPSAAISNHRSFVRKTTAASGQSNERISVVHGTTDINKAMLPFKLWGRVVEWWMTSWWCVQVCNR